MDRKELAPQTGGDFPTLSMPDVYDVTIVGGGPAGLSAALVLARCRRKVLVLDAGKPRNRWSRSMHGYLSRDGVPPSHFNELCRRDLNNYKTVDFVCVEVRDVEITEDGRFITSTADGMKYLSRKILLATGVVDDLPQLEGFEELYGRSVHHCPYCDGYEWRDKGIAVYGKCGDGFGLVQEMTAWTRDLVLITDGPCELDTGRLKHLAKMNIELIETPIARLEGTDGYLKTIHFADGRSLARDAMFFCTGQKLASEHLAQKLGCRMDEKGCIWTGHLETTNIEGVYCAGDASKNAQLVIVAAAEGAQAAVSINKSLTGEYKEVKSRVPTEI